MGKKGKKETHVLNRNRIELYKDFTLNLLYYINNYYLDKESLYTDDDIYNHYIFCFNKTCDDFLKENIDFRDNDELKSYYYSYYYSQFYTAENQQKLPFYLEFWDDIFKIDQVKNENYLNILIETYLIFDISLNHKKFISELI
jgi:hypothetical protein